MKALIRNDGETVTETDGIVGIDWNNGEPLTRPEWAGGPYRLVENYVEPEDELDGDGHVPVNTITEKIVEDKPAVVVVDGKEYTKEELLRLLAN